MKKIWLLVLLTHSAWQVAACDICNMSISLVPEDNQNWLSLNYRSRYTSGLYNMSGMATNVHTANRHTGPGSTSTAYYGKNFTEIFNVFDLKGRYVLSKRIMLTGTLPYIHNQQFMEGVLEVDNKGLGDPIVKMDYMLFNSKLSNPDSKVSQRIMVGFGVKLPFGHTSAMVNTNPIELDLQTGTGSLDYILSIEYMFKKGNFGFINNMNYKLNTANKEHYQYGNSWNHTLIAFYMLTLTDKFKVMPNAGMYFEYADNDKLNKTPIIQSGGDIFYANFGLNMYFKNFRIGTTYQLPIRNNLNGYSQLPVQNRILGDLMIYF